ncbi:hypothetical protein C8R44DRAFT_724413 [Mycena epipterygia]|nr:hypothetical protein C8R44DRAFT_724413 [Mycena epipterygia]
MPSKGTALVTGAARGIGKAIALRLADDGFDVAVVSHRSSDVELHMARPPFPSATTTTVAPAQGIRKIARNATSKTELPSVSSINVSLTRNYAGIGRVIFIQHGKRGARRIGLELDMWTPRAPVSRLNQFLLRITLHCIAAGDSVVRVTWQQRMVAPQHLR